MRRIPQKTASKSRRFARAYVGIFALFCSASAIAAAGPSVPVESTVQSLLQQEDTDHDGLITVRDQGFRRFLLPSAGGVMLVSGTYSLANLLEELSLASQDKKSQVILSSGTLFAPVTDRQSQLIQRDYWPRLTVRLDEKELARVFSTFKSDHQIIVPAGDSKALHYYRSLAQKQPSLNLQVVPSSASANGEVSLEKKPALISPAFDAQGLPLPYVTSNAKDGALTAWDSYFIVLGLLSDGRRDLAKMIVDQYIYQVRFFGRTLSSNRADRLTEAPPLLAPIIFAVYRAGPSDKNAIAWLRKGLNAAIEEYTQVWAAPPYQTATGLAGFPSSGGKVNPVGLNAMLYRCESDIGEIIQNIFVDHFILPNGHLETASPWLRRADLRQHLMQELLWDSKRSAYLDYDVLKKERIISLTPASFYPLWTGAADSKSAQSMMMHTLPKLDAPGGIPASLDPGSHSGMAADQIIIWQGLERYSHHNPARKLVYAWLFSILLNAAEWNGAIGEQYDLKTRSIVKNDPGLQFRGVADGGFGPTNASIEIGLKMLTPELKAALDGFIPPEFLFEVTK